MRIRSFLRGGVLPVAILLALLIWTEHRSPAQETRPKPFGPVTKLVIQGIEAKRGPVPFRHEFHKAKKAKGGLGIKCVECHHDAKKTGEFQECSNCHKATMEKEHLAAKKIFHKNCRGCHRKLVEAEPALEARAPTKCKGCHEAKP